ncbi:methylmalonyl Co-A mutase-associated GTPase MeaB [Psychroflexus sp. YR1-1]|uniref:Methylmalonyl Co-A mutase-associated GTPase MeaB n=1 Tax=Psychroflexus aurantiacus TaxID=2709310 RepID=A0A6B3QZX1_9FLAO|nr:methylmalonyl Co-A mutase-associated GTPase MeaB [Psychroflexus aurantiacus]NEV93893.1 methylmalonyl Co-A mutase-associated GTPase MeaB [Psychroflexus aurantiacus]
MPSSKNKKSALQETKSDPGLNLSQSSAEKIKALRRKSKDIQKLIQGILSGNKTDLSQAITLIESQSKRHAEDIKTIISTCLPYSNKSLRVGITGVPGVGKSTFIEQLGLLLVSKGHKVAVLAVDPSSSVTRGSILGDKTRMEKLVQHPMAYIRPTASGESLGGVARKTRESILLCEAAGFDILLIETVGVGQSETAVHSMTDFFLLLKLAGAGDELQGIKRGIIEMADAIVINKADGDNIKAAKKAKVEFNRALHMYPSKSNGWTPKVKLASALNNEGIENIWNMLSDYFTTAKTNGFFEEKRAGQNKFWLTQSIEDSLKKDFYQNENIKTEFPKILEKIHNQEMSPFEAAEYLLDKAKS